MPSTLDIAIGALNGLVGDYLARTQNGLAIDAQLFRDDQPITLSREGIAAALPHAPGRLAIFVHGLMSTEDVWWFPKPPAPSPAPAPTEAAESPIAPEPAPPSPSPQSYGSRLEADAGLCALYARYNSGRRISQSGEELDALLSALIERSPSPIDEIALFGHSMGGLVIRAATHVAAERGSAWLGLVKKAFYIGSPHLGAPLERLGNVLTWTLDKINHPITAVVADVVNLRSEGVKDLRYGNLRREDWEGKDADDLLQNHRHPTPLLASIRHHLVVGTLSRDVTSTILFGDVLVPVKSAAGLAKPADRAPIFPQEHVAIMPGRNHLQLAHDEAVYEHLLAWCKEPTS